MQAPLQLSLRSSYVDSFHVTWEKIFPLTMNGELIL